MESRIPLKLKSIREQVVKTQKNYRKIFLKCLKKFFPDFRFKNDRKIHNSELFGKFSEYIAKNQIINEEVVVKCLECFENGIYPLRSNLIDNLSSISLELYEQEIQKDLFPDLKLKTYHNHEKFEIYFSELEIYLIPCIIDSGKIDLNHDLPFLMIQKSWS